MFCARDLFTATQAGRLRGKSGRCPRSTINRSRAREDALRTQSGLVTGCWPALDHKSKPSAGSCIAPAILDWLRVAGSRSTINRSRAREDTLRTQSGLVTGCWPALDHKSKPSAGRCLADAIWLGTSLLVHASRKQGGHEKQICGRAAGCMGSLTVLITLLILERGSFSYRTTRPDRPFRAHFNLWCARHGWPLIHLVSRQDGQFSRPPYFRRP